MCYFMLSLKRPGNLRLGALWFFGLSSCHIDIGMKFNKYLMLKPVYYQEKLNGM